MLRISRAAAVAEKQDFAAAAQAVSNTLGRLDDAVFIFLKELCFDAKTLRDKSVNELRSVFHFRPIVALGRHAGFFSGPVDNCISAVLGFASTSANACPV